MYDDLLGEKKKKRVIVNIQDCDWDDDNKEVIVKREFDITCDENGVVEWEEK